MKEKYRNTEPPIKPLQRPMSPLEFESLNYSKFIELLKVKKASENTIQMQEESRSKE